MARFSSPVMPGPPSRAVVPTSESHKPTSPGRRGDETRATTGPRNDSAPVLPSSADSLAPPASGSSRAEPPGFGGAPPARFRKQNRFFRPPPPPSTTTTDWHPGPPPRPQTAAAQTPPPRTYP